MNKIDSTNFKFVQDYVQSLKDVYCLRKDTRVKKLEIFDDVQVMKDEIKKYEDLLKEFYNQDKDIIKVGKFYFYLDGYYDDIPTNKHFIHIKSKNDKRFIFDEVEIYQYDKYTSITITQDRDILKTVMSDHYYNDNVKEITEEEYNKAFNILFEINKFKKYDGNN